jgi:hypothetical protein
MQTATAIESSPSMIDVFVARCSARATLVASGLMDLQTAVDGMQETAATQGLLDEHGQDEIQHILSDAFARQR